MNCVKLIGFGVLIWGVAYILATASVAYNMDTGGMVLQLAVTAAMLSTAFLLARTLHISDRKEMLKYSFSWVAIALILDITMTIPFTGWEFFSSWNIWVSYFLLLLVPLLATKPKMAIKEIRPEEKQIKKVIEEKSE